MSSQQAADGGLQARLQPSACRQRPEMVACFPPSVRLRARHEFEAVKETGLRVSTRYMTLLGRPNGRDRDRLGIIASRRLGGAVVRNRAKRRLREVFRRQEPESSSARGLRTLDLVAIPRRELLATPFVLLTADFQAAVRRLRVAR
jgi:ribonuclease P protein component